MSGVALSHPALLTDQDFMFLQTGKNFPWSVQNCKSQIVPYLNALEIAPTHVKWTGIKHIYLEIEKFPQLSQKVPILLTIVETIVRIWWTIHPKIAKDGTVTLASEISAFFGEKLEVKNSPRIIQDTIFSALLQAIILTPKKESNQEIVNKIVDNRQRRREEINQAIANGNVALQILRNVESPAFNSMIESCCKRLIDIQNKLFVVEVEFDKTMLVTEADYLIGALVKLSKMNGVEVNTQWQLTHTFSALLNGIKENAFTTFINTYFYRTSASASRVYASDELIPLAAKAVSSLHLPQDQKAILQPLISVSYAGV